MRGRIAVGWTLAVAGLIAYNWWILVPLKPGLMSSPNELFSNLEVTGQPYATVMQHADTLSGALLLIAFAVLGYRASIGGRGEWLALLLFAACGSLGGLFPEVCADGISARCRSHEWKFQLPVSQYLHITAGIFEFAGITIALLLAYRRIRDEHSQTGARRAARIYRFLGVAAIIGYPLLGIAYLINLMGGVMEGAFFVGFTVLVLTQVAERTAALRRGQVGELLAPDLLAATASPSGGS